MTTRDERPGPAGRTARSVALALFWLLLTAALLEGGARLVLLVMGPGSAPIQLGWAAGKVRDLVYVPDPELFFRLTPNLDVAETGNPRIFDLQTNALGLRGGEIARPKPPGTYRVLAVGDSCTFGSGAGSADTYPAQLERQLRTLRQDMGFEVLNAGVPGFTSYQALRYLETEGFDLQPDAVLFGTGVNDAGPARAGRKRRFGKGRMLSDREYAAALRAQRGLGIRRLLWRAGLGFDPAGSPVGKAGDVKRRVPLAEYEKNLLSFAEQSRARGIRPLIVAWPLKSQVGGLKGRTEVELTVERYQRAAAAAAAAQAAPFVDLGPPLLGRTDLFIDVVHLSPRGYGVVAERIARELAEHLPGALPPAARARARPGAPQAEFPE
jgi:lysophospholipase L1-like esterase